MPEFNNTDKLDMAGDWTWNISVTINPQAPFLPGFFHTIQVHFDDDGPGSHGGRKYKGKWVEPPKPGLVMTAETVYLKRGVQLVQMLCVEEATQYLMVLSGKHVPDSTEPRKIWIFGAGFDVGQSEFVGPSGQGTAVTFEMIKRAAGKSK